MTNIDVYGAAWCQPCSRAKRWFDNKGIAYTYHDVDTEPGALDKIKELGYSGVPVIVRDNEVELGFTPARFADLVK